MNFIEVATIQLVRQHVVRINITDPKKVRNEVYQSAEAFNLIQKKCMLETYMYMYVNTVCTDKTLIEKKINVSSQ